MVSAFVTTTAGKHFARQRMAAASRSRSSRRRDSSGLTLSPRTASGSCSSQVTKGNSDILMATLGPPLEIRPLIQTPFSESGPAISPDGRWVAYASNESGRSEVYVRPFPEVEQGGRWQVSTDGGNEPRWARNGRELVFRTGGGPSGTATILSAMVASGPTFVASRPAVVLKLPNTSSFAYDVAPDGRFLLHRNASATGDDQTKPQIVMVQNWFEELKARMRSSSATP